MATAELIESTSGNTGYLAGNNHQVTVPIGQASEQARVMAEIQSALTIAAHRPRDEQRAIDRIMVACQRQGLAEVAEYVYSRGGTEIRGASIDLMTAVANYWGNIQFGFRELSQRNGASEVEAFAWDLESNSKRNVIFTVPHVRTTKSSTTKLTDPRDIYELIANQAQRRVRACLESVIPSDVVDLAVEECNKTLNERSPVTPETIKKLLATFAEIGVTQEQIELRLQRKIETITPSQMANMRKIFKSIKDGMSKPESWFSNPKSTEAVDDGKPAASLKERIKAKTQQEQPAMREPGEEG